MKNISPSYKSMYMLLLLGLHNHILLNSKYDLIKYGGIIFNLLLNFSIFITLVS